MALMGFAFLKPTIDGSNLGQLGRDQPIFKPYMGRLIVPNGQADCT